MEKYKKVIEIQQQFIISIVTWHEEFQLPDESYFELDVQDYLECFLKKYGEKTNDPSIRIYINKIGNMITFKIKRGYYLEFLTSETMKILKDTKRKITKNENGENVPHLEYTEAVLVHCNIANNNYQQNSRVLYTFVPNKLFGQLLDISPKSFIFLKTFDSEFSYIEVWLSDQNSKPREIEDKINITLVIN